MVTIIRHACRAIAALVLVALLGTPVRAQPQDDVEALMAANNAYYAALSTLDLMAMNKVWAHEGYVSQVGPRNAAPLVGWATMQPYLAKTWANFAELKVKPVDPRGRVNGNVGWVIGKGEVGASSRPTIVTNIFERHEGKWLMVSHHAQEPSQ